MIYELWVNLEMARASVEERPDVGARVLARVIWSKRKATVDLSKIPDL